MKVVSMTAWIICYIPNFAPSSLLPSLSSDDDWTYLTEVDQKLLAVALNFSVVEVCIRELPTTLTTSNTVQPAGVSERVSISEEPCRWSVVDKLGDHSVFHIFVDLEQPLDENSADGSADITMLPETLSLLFPNHQKQKIRLLTHAAGTMLMRRLWCFCCFRKKLCSFSCGKFSLFPFFGSDFLGGLSWVSVFP